MMSSDRSTTPLSDEIIGGRFRIRERLDATGRADVYEAEHVLIHKRVALKVARASTDPGEKNVARFQRVARVATQLDHPNCAKISDFGLDDRGYVYLAMELAEGRDLRRILAEDGPLTPEEVVTIGMQGLAGLGDAHQRGILHTELAPHYVMVDLATGMPTVKLLGFGLGQLMKGMEKGAASRALVSGAPADYAAPELLQPGAPVDHRVDQFALAAVLFEAVTGRLPWDNAVGDPLSRVTQPARRASRVRTDGQITMALDRVLAQALDPEPSRRFSDTQEFSDALNRAVHGDPREVSTVASVHRQFGRYKLLRSIARGGMGELHLASSETLPGLTKVCALKRLRPELAAEKSYVDRFLSEARLAAQLSHANLATVYDVGKAEDSFYMAMEFIIGKDCRRIIDRAREDGLQVPVEVAIFIARDLADALGYAHRVKLPSGDVGLIHRDVSPTNVLVSYEGLVKLIDFGLAKHATAQGKTETGVVIGKVAYMAPEQCLCEPLDHRADIYSVGSVLFELLTGRRLREGEDFEQLAAQVRLPPDKLPGDLRDDVPPELDRVVARALAPDPAERYPHAEGLRDDLAQILAALNPRTSRDTVAGFLKLLFPAEQQSETELAQGLLTEAAPPRPDSAIMGAIETKTYDDGDDTVVGAPELKLVAGVAVAEDDFTGKTMAMPVIPPEEAERIKAEVLEGKPSSAVASTLIAGDSGETVGLATDGRPKRPSEEIGVSDTLDGHPAVQRSSVPTEEPLPVPKARGPGWAVAVVLLVLGLGGGGAVGYLALPDLLGKRKPPPNDSAGAQGGSAQRATTPAMAPPMAPPMREVVRLPRPVAPPVVRGPSLEELTRQAATKNFDRLARLASAALFKVGVRPADLPALPKIQAAYGPVIAAVKKRDFEGSISALMALRTLLEGRRNACKKVRRRKFKWAKKAVRSIRKAAPRRRADRKKFLELHKWKDLRDQVKIVKKRSRDRKLTCAEKSLAYKNLIADLQKTLAKVAPPKGDKSKSRSEPKKDR
jgi:serine/threonine protein kinase